MRAKSKAWRLATVDYTGLFQRLGERSLSRTAFAKLLGVSSRTIAKIGRGEPVSGRVINRMAVLMDALGIKR